MKNAGWGRWHRYDTYVSMESTSIELQLTALGMVREGNFIKTEGTMGVGGGKGEAI